MSRVDVIVSTFNHPDLLAKCLASLAQSTCQDYRLIVVDDHSDHPVTEIVRRTHPTATIIRSKQNRGLVRCLNAAIRHGNSPLVAVLNDDTELDPDWLQELVSCADRHPEAGAIASRMRLMSDRRRMHSAGDYMTVTGMPGSRGVWLEDVGQYDQEEEVFAPCGGAVLYRRSAIEAVMLDGDQIFDSRLFMYCEDVDLAWRLQSNGYRVWYAPKAIVYHQLSATAGGPLASYYVHRNIWLVLARRMPSEIRRRYWPRIAARHLGRGMQQLRHLREPAARAGFRGWTAGLAMSLPELLRQPRIDSYEAKRIEMLLVDPARRHQTNLR